MSQFNNYEQKQIYLIAEHHPFSASTVADVYEILSKSFDDTEKCLKKAMDSCKHPEEIALSIRKRKTEYPTTDFSYLGE